MSHDSPVIVSGVKCLFFLLNGTNSRTTSLNVFVDGMKHTVQEFLLHHDLLGVQIFHIMEKGLFIVQMIKSKANNVCMRGQDN